ncbi:hypothetical protein BD779DRAFT_1681231 [Infundibulicybe gibba]|nr:hypothetical protein BD779DRAFT_1681231 [Infundibulicybe gibba]
MPAAGHQPPSGPDVVPQHERFKPPAVLYWSGMAIYQEQSQSAGFTYTILAIMAPSRLVLVILSHDDLAITAPSWLVLVVPLSHDDFSNHGPILARPRRPTVCTTPISHSSTNANGNLFSPYSSSYVPCSVHANPLLPLDLTYVAPLVLLKTSPPFQIVISTPPPAPCLLIAGITNLLASATEPGNPRVPCTRLKGVAHSFFPSIPNFIIHSL